MNTVTLEMPLVTECLASLCAYNKNQKCHARAITIGDTLHPGCDTFLKGSAHIKQASQIAGIGACKMGNCKYNEDFECVAESVRIGVEKRGANCNTFAP